MSRSLYAQFLDGQTWKLTLGVDTPTAKVSSVRSILHSLGRIRGLRVVTRMDGAHLYVKAVQRDKDR